MTKIDYSKLPPECDALCAFRRCLMRGEDKGSFTPGVGYTSYHDESQYVCMTRHAHGCPHPFSAPDGSAAGSGRRVGRRPIPDHEKLLAHFDEAISKVRCSHKVQSMFSDIRQALVLYHELGEWVVWFGAQENNDETD